MSDKKESIVFVVTVELRRMHCSYTDPADHELWGVEVFATEEAAIRFMATEELKENFPRSYNTHSLKGFLNEIIAASPKSLKDVNVELWGYHRTDYFDNHGKHIIFTNLERKSIRT